MGKRFLSASGCLGLCLMFLISTLSCSDGNQAKARPNANASYPVTVSRAARKTVPVQLRAIGNIRPYSTVSIKAQVEGQIVRVHFREGQDVKRGDLLFSIDPKPFETMLRQAEANLAKNMAQVKQAEANLAKEGAQVKQAEANLTRNTAQVREAEANLVRYAAQVRQAHAALERDRAQVKQAEAALERSMSQAQNAEVEAQRYDLLLQKGVVAREQRDRFRTTSDSMQATVRADKAAIENARAAVRASEAALDNAEAAVRASRAAVENTEAVVQAGKAAVENAQAVVQAAKAAVETTDAAVLADRAAVETARIHLGYCSIRSPMDGRTGSLIVQEGNIVKANDASLVVINQITPIYAAFSIPEQHLPDVKKYMASGTLKVEALIPQDRGRPEEGTVSFVDNAVDSATGTIRLKGTFANRERRLWPGQFVNVVLTLTRDPDAVVVPSQTVQTGQQGQYVFVVKADSTVEMRPVTVRRTFDGESIIQSGLAPGETVVTEGQLRLHPGAKVESKGSDGAGSPPGGKIP